MTTAPARYHPALVTLHWIAGLGLIGMLAFGKLVLEGVSNADPAKAELLRLHMAGGLGLLLIMLVRLVVRFTTRRPAPAHAGGPLRLAARASHLALYLFSFAMLVTGLGMAQLGGLFPLLQGQPVDLPDFGTLPPHAGHVLFSSLLIALIALHAGAALWHQFGRRDGVLGRMGFGSR